MDAKRGPTFNSQTPDKETHLTLICKRVARLENAKQALTRLGSAGVWHWNFARFALTLEQVAHHTQREELCVHQHQHAVFIERF